MINIKRGSTTHIALKYLKMKSNTYSDVESLFNLSPTRFKDRSKAARAYLQLVKHGYAIERNNSFQITSSGIQALHLIVRQSPKSQILED